MIACVAYQSRAVHESPLRGGMNADGARPEDVYGMNACGAYQSRAVHEPPLRGGDGKSASVGTAASWAERTVPTDGGVIAYGPRPDDVVGMDTCGAYQSRVVHEPTLRVAAV